MKTFKILTISLVVALGSIMDVEAQFTGFSLETINSVSHLVKHFNEDRFMFKTEHGPLLTLHKGSSADNAKVHIGNDALSFSSSDYKLYVEEGILSESLKINNPQDWSDFVFDESYQLKPLEEVARFIKEKKHLPDVPSEQELIKQGYYDQHEINKVLLQKIEELTLYIIQQKKELDSIKSQYK